MHDNPNHNLEPDGLLFHYAPGQAAAQVECYSHKKVTQHGMFNYTGVSAVRICNFYFKVVCKCCAFELMQGWIVSLTILSFLLIPSVFACGEGYTSIPVDFSGVVKTGDTFRKDITQNYYFASGFLNRMVKVAWPDNGGRSIYFWLVPDSAGWQIKIGPTQEITPDYIDITTWPVKTNSSLYVNKTTLLKIRSFCFNADPYEYDAALSEIKKKGKSGMIDIFAASCKDITGDSMGQGIFTIKNISADQLEFTVELKIPVLTSDCPPP